MAGIGSKSYGGVEALYCDHCGSNVRKPHRWDMMARRSCGGSGGEMVLCAKCDGDLRVELISIFRKYATNSNQEERFAINGT